jgi:CDP-glycerol glycerophosphotransferase (TagB/SpsB family)
MLSKKIKNILLYLLNIPLYWVSKLLPKNKNIWVFGAWFGNKYADNSKYLFEYINEFQPQIRAIWLTNSDEVVDKLKLKDYEVYKRYSLKAINVGLRAKYSIFVHSNSADGMMFLNNNAKLIQLWHGIPLKKIGNDDLLIFNPKFSSNIKQVLFPFANEYYDCIISSSEEDKSKFTTAFNSKNIVIAGYPRNDVLFNCKYSDNSNVTITYLPTFRDNLGDQIDLFTDFGFIVEKWNTTLKRLNIILNIKMHPVNKPKDDLLKEYIKYECINFLNEVDVAELLLDTDILITDYSSVYFDFLLTNKPIIFAPFDFDKYIKKDRELYYDYNEVTPGPKCKNWDEVLEWVVMFKENQEIFKNEREVVKNRFHKFQDGRSCERVYNEIIKLSN